jgi:hypothetical protein
MGWQGVVVALIVALALLFALWRLPGTAARLRYVGWLKQLSHSRGPLGWLALRLEARIRRSESACSGCSAENDHRHP